MTSDDVQRRVVRGFKLTEATAAVNLVAHTDPRRTTQLQMILIEAGLDPEIVVKRARDDGDILCDSGEQRNHVSTTPHDFDSDPQFDWKTASGRWSRRVRSGLAAMPSGTFLSLFGPGVTEAAKDSSSAAAVTSHSAITHKVGTEGQQLLPAPKKSPGASSFSEHFLMVTAVSAPSTALTLVPVQDPAAPTSLQPPLPRASEAKAQHSMPEATVFRRYVGLARRLSIDKSLSDADKVVRLAEAMGKGRASFSRKRKSGDEGVGAAAALGAVTHANQAFVAGLEKGGAMKALK